MLNDTIQRVVKTVGWGTKLRDKALIAAYYGLLGTSGVLQRGGNLGAGIHPEFWLGDVDVTTPIGQFACRGRTIDFDIVNPNYEAALVEALQVRFSGGNPDGAVFVDVGAHAGKYSVLVGRLLRNRETVLAVEPDPANFAALRANLALNELRNVRPLNLGCWSEDGTRVLHRDPRNIGGHSLVEARGREGVPVRVRTLDGILSDEGVDHVDVLKVDVERAEAHVFRGARGTLESNPGVTVFFEEARDPRTAESIQFLRSLGFDVRRLAGIIYVGVRSRK